MDHTTPFDRKIDALTKNARAPEGLVDSAIYVRDTMEIAWEAAASIFGPKATAEAAIAIYDRINVERLRKTAKPGD